jgi:hypothetical protein
MGLSSPVVPAKSSAAVMAATAIEAMGGAGAATSVDIATSWARGLSMAHISGFSIVTYERKPGHWRAAISPKVRDGSGAPGKTVHSTVTPDDSASESEAKFAAELLIRKL